LAERSGHLGDEPVLTRRHRAAEYVRMSTEHQRYSTENQAKAIRQYATARAIDVVRTYADEGKSGLSIDGRSALKSLIEDVERGRAEFETILVFDVSRWGRFQDADESAYYEYICKRAGITVQYCAEQFENDGSPISTIVKGVKRAMAGEYSRELSTKVFAGKGRLIELGFRQGGRVGCGLRRVLIDQSGVRKAELRNGERKSIQTDRVVLVAGSEAEVALVREIYRQFVQDLTSEQKIADNLNTRGMVREDSRPWTRSTIRQVLMNEKYIGNNVWNRVSFKLRKKRVRNHPDMWIRADGVFPGIVDRHLFDAAQTIIQARSFARSEQAMLDGLARLWESTGSLSAFIIDDAEGIPSSDTYNYRFGSLSRAYQLIGYTPRRDLRYVEINRVLRTTLHPQVLSAILDGLRGAGCHIQAESENSIISVNGEITISIVIARCLQMPSGSYRWRLRLDADKQADVTIAVRMDAINQAPLDYYLLPRIDIETVNIQLAEANGLGLDGYRFDTLETFYESLEPVTVAEAA
jgi:DNA invertase Pin-like site-specific DNA recombinase